MDKMIENEISSLITKIVEVVHVHKIILFGSYAQGTSNQDSDIDLCILTDEIKGKWML